MLLRLAIFILGAPKASTQIKKRETRWSALHLPFEPVDVFMMKKALTVQLIRLCGLCS